MVQSRRDHAAVDAQHRLRPRRLAPVGAHRLDQRSRVWKQTLSSAARASSVGAGGAREAEQRAAHVGVPVRRAEADEGRHQIDVLRRDRRFAASGPVSRPRVMMLSPSRSHCTAAPATKIEPSSA